jgi:hypothetical protein
VNNLSNKSWHVLNIDISNAIQPNFSFDNILAETPELAQHLKEFQWVMQSYRQGELLKVFTKEWLNYMAHKNLEISAVLLFYRQAHCDEPPHCDLPFNPQGELSCSINWVLGEDTGDMIWYLPPVNSDNGQYALTTNDLKYMKFAENELTEIERRQIGNLPTLVRVDIPHKIAMRETSRLLISVRTKFKSNSWDQMLEHLKPHILQN